jgi:RHS repeat-associated protein
VTNGYSADGLTSWSQDDSTTGTASGRITTLEDLLGRVVSTTDVWGTVTTSSYDILGHLVSTATVADGQTYTTAFTYTLDGRVDTVSDNGTVIADPSYTQGLLTGVAYPAGAGNGTAAATGYDAAGRVESLAWSFADGSSATDAVEHSQSGRIVTDTIQNGVTPADPDGDGYASNYAFDAVGRLITANIPGHALAYQYASTGGCGTSGTAGANGNRTSTTDTPSGGGGLSYSTSYCYDKADRLLSALETVTGAAGAPAEMVRPANPLAAADISYDAHGNVTRLGNQTFTYDASDRHMSTTATDPSGVSTVSYVRDVTGAIISRTETPGGGVATTVRYSGSLLLDGSNHVIQRTISLPGGVTVSCPTGGPAVWSYPDLHGDSTWTADAAGAPTGFFLYDPFGQPIDLATMVIGSATADQAVPDTQPGAFDPGWVGLKGKGYEHLGSIATIEMGVRVYSAVLGRFLAADPVAGGNSSRYNYPNDPINKLDLDGKRQDCGSTCSYASLMEGISVDRDGAASSARARGWTPSGPYVPEIDSGQVWALAVPVMANDFDRLAVITSGAAIGADIFGAPEVGLALGLGAAGFAEWSAITRCSVGWGSQDCSVSVELFAWSLITVGGAQAIKEMSDMNVAMPRMSPGEADIRSGAIESGFTSVGLVHGHWFDPWW